MAAIAALSEWLAIGICAVASAAACTSAGSPSRSAPTSRVSASPGAPSPSCASAGPSPATSATVRPGSSAGERGARASATVKTAPMLARTALGPNGSAQPGPRTTDAAPKACAERSTAPTLPGSPTPYRATHSGPVAAGAQRSS